MNDSHNLRTKCKERMNWIDWVKAICMTGVVIIHLPQQDNSFYVQYLGAVILSPFFFVSGYMKRETASTKATVRKYGYSLLIPYIIYNVLYYPYWLVKFYVEHHGAIGLEDCLKPVIGTILLQLNSSFSSELNGVTWFLIALFAMHWLTDVCSRQKHGPAIMAALAVGCMVLYGANKYYHYAPYLTYHGFVRCICFYLMGYLFRKRNWLKAPAIKKDGTIGLIALCLSIVTFYWHIHEERFILHILLFYLVNTLAVLGIIHLCRALDGLHSNIVTWISMGTLVIFGLHRILIGCMNFGLERLLKTGDIGYSWYESTLLAVAIDMLLLPVIIYAIKSNSVLLCRRK